MRKIFKEIYTRISKLQFFILIFSKIVLKLASPVIILLNGIIVDSIISERSLEATYKYILVLAITYIVNIGTKYLQRIYEIIVQEQIIFIIEQYVIMHLTRCDLRYVNKNKSSYLYQRIHTDSTDVSNYLIACTDMFIDSVVFIYIFIYIFSKNEFVIKMLLLFTPIYIIFYLKLRKKIGILNLNVKETQNHYQKLVYQQIDNMEEISICCNFKETKNKAYIYYDKYKYNFLLYIKTMGRIESFENIVIYLFYIAITISSAKRILNNSMTIGDFAIINGFFAKGVSSVKLILEYIKQSKLIKVNLARINQLMNSKDIIHEGIKIKEIRSIRIENINFKYPESNRKVIKDISYTFRKNKIYGIRGNNGTGKTTIAKILIGLYPIDSGNLLINGINIDLVDIEWYRKNNIEFLSQNYRKTFKEILEDEEIIRNLEQLDFFLELNLNKYIRKDFDELSGGELQKLLFSYALSSKKDVIIMDEPTSAFDTYSINLAKYEIQKSKKEKIIIIITHDDRLLEVFDEIIVLE